MRRVGITGIGLVSALGTTRDECWRQLVAGRCGVGPLTLFESEGFRSRIAAQVDDAAVDAAFTPLQRRRWSRSDKFALHAAREAVADAGLSGAGHAPDRVAVVLGASTGDLFRNERYLRASLEPAAGRRRLTDAWNHFCSTSVDLIATEFGFEGMRSCIVAACASSTMAVGTALDAIRFGRADAVLAGGTDALARLTYAGFNALKVMDPERCRPFDRSRNGMNIGEGAAVMVLEDLDWAKRRGARIYAEVAGHTLTCEAFHPTAPEPDGKAIAETMARALRDAKVAPDDIRHVNAHGTATPHNDRAESRGIRLVFGDGARRLPVTSIKSMIGHTLGASGGIEAAVTALSVFHGIIPPTIHHSETDPECEVDVVANAARELPLPCVLSTSLAFGGNDAAVVLRAV